jgi:hypothetical protein
MDFIARYQYGVISNRLKQPITDRVLISNGLSHPVYKTNQVLPICMPGSSSMHIVTSLVNNRNNIMYRKGDYHRFTAES